MVSGLAVFRFDFKAQSLPHSVAAALAALTGFRFGFVAAFFRARGRFGDFEVLALPAADVTASFAGTEAAFFRRSSRCLRDSLSRK